MTSRDDRSVTGQAPDPSTKAPAKWGCNGRVGYWLRALADPHGVRSGLPRCLLEVTDLPHLEGLADEHGVLPSVVQNLQRVRQSAGVSRIIIGRGSGPALERDFQTGLALATRRVFERMAASLALRQQARAILDALADHGVPAVLLKGPTFADRLYPTPGLRTFTDVDLLVPLPSWEETERLVRQWGYEPQDGPTKYAAGYGERSWRRPKWAGMLEIHHNLVNSPALRKGLSLGFDDLQFETYSACPGSREPGYAERNLTHRRLSASSLLLIAAVHGAASHAFDKLQHLCDVCQAARGAAGPLDEAWLAETARRTGSGLALATALDLAGRTLAEPACAQVLARLRLSRPPLWVRPLLTPGVVLRSQGASRPWSSWRRQLFRHLLKRAA